MEKFRVFSLKAQLLCLILILSQDQIDANTIKGSLSDIARIFKLMQALISPYMSKMQNSTGPHFRALKEQSVEKVIKEKIQQLKPFLQDDDDVITTKAENETDNLKLEGKDETTIIEFVPSKKIQQKNNLRNKVNIKRESERLKNKIDKYKEIRRKIKEALKKEHVSQNTLTLVTNTLDDMMTRIIENRCTWRSRHDNELNKIQKRVDTTMSIANEWNTRWNKLKKKYIKFEKYYANETFPGSDLFLFFKQFHEFFGNIGIDLKELGQYKIICELANRNSLQKKIENKINLKIGKNSKEIKMKHKCRFFKICSTELSKFMTDLYIMLNDTIVSTFRNYASMYVRDVNTEDSQEKEVLVNVLNNVSNLAEKKTTIIFIKETEAFKLSNERDENTDIEALKGYIKNTILNTKINIKDMEESGLKSLKACETVEKDLNVNLDVELDNLERDFRKRICAAFSICNGKYKRRHGDGDADLFNRNSVYVKVQLSLDDDFKDIVGKRPHFVPQVPKTELKKKKKHRYNIQTKSYRKIDGVMNDMYVTRTTLASSNATDTTFAKSDKSATSVASGSTTLNITTTIVSNKTQKNVKK